MRINWKVRFRNKTWLFTFVIAVVGTVYQFLDTFGIVPSIPQETVKALIFSIVDILAILGLVIDPTTPDINDSERALGYTIPGGTEKERLTK